MIVIASDHGGFALKAALIEDLRARGATVVDLGTNGPTSVDYPDFGRAVAERVASGEADRGVLICTNGIGMSVVANRFPGVRAALVGDAIAARMAREHIDANVLVLGGGMTGAFQARELLRIFLDTAFEGGRHERRLGKIEEIERALGHGRPTGALR